MSIRQEFVMFATQEGANRRELCRRYGISPKTGYKWLRRAAEDPAESFGDRSRRPHTSPTRTPPQLEQLVVAARRQHPAWGGRKLHHWLKHQGVDAVPEPSTITDILHRYALIDPQQTLDAQTPQRFEHPVPNVMWQVDFMGHLAMVTGRVHPLTLIDDHSRFVLGVRACANQQRITVEQALTDAFRHYGMPASILTDNGPPWGSSRRGGITSLEAWLIRLGLRVCHGRPYHPQTQGKIERLHRTIAAELTRTQRFVDLAAAQRAFDRWRHIYNVERPHEALDYAVPASRYHPSPISFPESLPPIEYGPDDLVRLVRGQGSISFQNHIFFVSRGLIGLPVAVRPSTTDGIFVVYFCHQQVKLLDLTNPSEV